MKKTFLVIAAGMLLTGGAGLFAAESMVIDFTQLDADIVADANGNPTQNSRTVMNYAAAAGATFTAEQRDLMKTSLALPEWEVVLNSSAQNVQSMGVSTVVAAPVRSEADVPFAGSNVMGVRVLFPEWNSNANARIEPPFDIPAFEPLAGADADGNRQAQTDEEKASGKTLFEDGFGVVRNVGAIKSIAVTTMGMNYPEGLYVLLKDNDGIERRYFMGYLGFDGWKELVWNNPQYIADIRNREIRVYRLYPRGLPYAKLSGIYVTRDAAHDGGDFIGYFKQIDVIYDKAVAQTERDIADEDLWGIVTEKEQYRQSIEMRMFGSQQVNRFIEKNNMAKEEGFSAAVTSSTEQQ